MFVEYFGISMEIAWRHLTIIVISAMKKFEPNQILWTKHPTFLTLWPAKVLRKVGKEGLEVLFVNEKVQGKQVVQENTCKNFAECHVDPKDSPIQLYDAFLMARKEHLRSRQTKAEEEECTHEEMGKEWGVTELKNCVDLLLIEVPSGSALEKMKLGLQDFTVKKEDMRAYMCELLTQKLSYLLSQADMEPSLRGHLNNVQRSLTELLCTQFQLGSL